MRAVLGLGLALAAAPALAEPASPGGHLYAQPSDIAATEIAMARTAREKGAEAATRRFAAPGAELLAPQPVRVATWQATRDAPPATRNVTRIWISCDGSYALSFGNWTQGPAQGWYATIWQRQKKGEYRFVLDQAGPLTTAPPPADTIDARTAECPARTPRPGEGKGFGPATVRDEIDAGRLADEDARPPKKKKRDAAPPDPNAANAKAALTADWLNGVARDRTLGWSTTIGADGRRRLAVRVKAAGQWAEVLRADAPASAVTPR